MRVLVQKVKSASVTVDGQVVGSIGRGILIFLGVGDQDHEEDAAFLAEKCSNLRIFHNQDNAEISVKDFQGDILAVSQFTLYGDCDKGRRPSYTRAAKPERGRYFYELFLQYLRQSGLKVESGMFQAEMQVNLINDGPMTFFIESEKHGASKKQ